MIFRFALDPGFFESARQHSLDDAVFEQHERFLEMWCHYGALVSDLALDTLLNQQLNGVHLEIRKRWQAALKQDNRYRRCSVAQVSAKPLWEAESGADVELLDDQVQTVFVDQHKRPILQQSWKQTSEVCSFQAPSRSEGFRISRALDEVGVAPMSREDLWEQHFRPLAELSRNVAVVDRYAVHRWLVQVDPEEPQDGLSFLLQKLSELPKRCTVKVVSAALKRSSEESGYFPTLREARIRDMEDLMQHIPLGSIRKLTLCLLPNSVFRDDVHYRFIRFDKTFISTDKGVGIFDTSPEQPKVQRATLLRYTQLGNVCEQAEHELDRQGAQKPTNKRDFSQK
jgi:hypothetical protein